MEHHFADQFRLNPGGRCVRLRLRPEGAFLPDQRIQCIADFLEHPSPEAASGMADIDQLPPQEDAQDQGPELLSAPPRFREARDHALLRQVRFHLQPMSTSFSHPVYTLRMLGDDPLEPLFLHDPEKQDALLPDVIAEFNIWCGGKNIFKKFFSSGQGEIRYIVSLE